MNNKNKGENNIFYFFLIAVFLHLSMFFVKSVATKGNAPVNFQGSNDIKTTIAVQVKNNNQKPTISSNTTQPPAPPKEKKEEVKPEIKEVKKEEVKKEIVKPEVKSKIKDKKKEVKKPEQKEVKNIPTKKVEKDVKTTSNNMAKTKEVESTTISNEDILSSGNFSIGKDGILVAGSSEGIQYKILKQVEPQYPIQAERIRYRNKVVVSARFLVGLTGEVEKIEIIQSHSKLGFDKAVMEALKQWKFHPIFYKNKNIKVYFTKDFIFEPKI